MPEKRRKSQMNLDLASSLLGEPLLTAKDYLTIPELLTQSTFSDEEQELVFYVLNKENPCEYCILNHINSEEPLEEPVFIKTLREGSLDSDLRMEELYECLGELIQRRGTLSTAQIKQFLSAGFTEKNVMELVTAHAMQTIHFYTYHIGK